ncbi:hypothetical protein IE53DRAFT_280305 [Violaceomyces palustris]|uniref:Uncharacterized protein n=1 Tax=Violaceomyces palustris TaxID=1673888 RepID=A0ACD0P2W2_9BASI|nr:hypothetical protein IE53DRAFT_280305 [Violaceomyces palustris]
MGREFPPEFPKGWRGSGGKESVWVANLSVRIFFFFSIIDSFRRAENRDREMVEHVGSFRGFSLLPSFCVLLLPLLSRIARCLKEDETIRSRIPRTDEGSEG